MPFDRDTYVRTQERLQRALGRIGVLTYRADRGRAIVAGSHQQPGGEVCVQPWGWDYQPGRPGMVLMTPDALVAAIDAWALAHGEVETDEQADALWAHIVHAAHRQVHGAHLGRPDPSCPLCCTERPAFTQTSLGAAVHLGLLAAAVLSWWVC